MFSLGRVDYHLFAQVRQDIVNIDKEARLHYEKKDFCKAFPLYSQLLSLDKTNAEYAFRFGVCLLHCDRRDVELPIKYIKQSQGKLKTADSIYFYFYLGLACHQAFRFGEAARAFTVFLQKRGISDEFRREAKLRLHMCENAIRLMKNLSEIAVLKKITADYGTFYKSYDLSKFEGSIGKKPDFLKTSYDRKMKDDGLVFFYPKSNDLYYSSYGKNGSTGKDIYRVQKLPNGKWGKPERLSDRINTPYDEDYPVLMDGGKTLYFCSKGHNSMGGYDIFKAVWDESSQSWSEPENLDFAINTPFDDILFVPHPTLKYAWFASNRMVAEGKLHVFLVKIDKTIREFDDYKPQLLAVDYIQVNSEEYVKTIEKIQRIASLEVNTKEEIPETKDTAKYVLWQRYNIPPNPVDTQLINRAFFYSADAEKKLNDFSRKRAFYNQLSVKKKNEAINLNQQGQNLYDKALKENDPEKRKSMLSEANELLKRSNEILSESEIARKMYVQFDQAYGFQQKKYDELLYLAGRVQQTALARNIDSSVVLLIHLINKVDTFKFQLIQLEHSFEGDSAYLIDQERNYELMLSELQQKEKQLQQTENKIISLEAQLKKTSDPDVKQNLENQKNQYLQEKNALNGEIQNLKQKIDLQQNNLAQQRQELAIRQKIKSEYDMASRSGQLASLVVDEKQKPSQTSSGQNPTYSAPLTDRSQQPTANNSQQVRIQNQNNPPQQSKIQEEEKKRKETVFRQRIEENLNHLASYEKQLQDSATYYDNLKNNLSKNYIQKKDEYESKLKESSPSLDDVWNMLAEIQAIYEAITYAEQKKTFYEQQRKQTTSLRNEFSKLSILDSSRISVLEKQKLAITDATPPLFRISTSTKQDSLRAILDQLREKIDPLTERKKYLTYREDSLSSILDKTRNKKKRLQIERELNLVRLNINEVNEEIQSLEKQKEKAQAPLLYYQKVQQSWNDLQKRFDQTAKKSSGQTPAYLSAKVGPVVPPWNTDELNQVRKELLVQENTRNNQLSDQKRSQNWSSWLGYASPGSIKNVRQFLDGDESKEKNVQAFLFRQAGDAIMLKVVELKNNPSGAGDRSKQEYVTALEKMAQNYYEMAKIQDPSSGGKKLENNNQIQISDLHPSLVAQYHMEKYHESLRRRDSLQNELARVRTPQEKTTIERKIEEQNNLARYHYYLAQDIYGIWNHVQLEWLHPSDQIHDGTTNDIVEARKLRSQAFQEKDFSKQQKLYEKANEKELNIIQKLSTMVSKDTIINKMQRLATDLEKEKKKTLQQIFDTYFSSSEKKDELLMLAQQTNRSDRQTNPPSQERNVNVRQTDVTNRNYREPSQTSTLKGIYYRVQIAASKREVNPREYFNEVDVVVNYHHGWYCYLKGIFYCYDDARKEMLRLRADRYKDAFLVAFTGNDRIPVYEARKFDTCAMQIAQGMGNTSFAQFPGSKTSAPVLTSNVDGLVFTVQVGVFATPRSSVELFGLNPLFYDRMENGYYRYFCGLFVDLNEANRLRDQLRATVVRDAFVVALYRGKKISVAEARQLIQKGVPLGTSYQYEKQVAVEPIEFRIQIGAYRNEVPVSVVNKMLEVSTNMGVDKIYQDDITCYTVGKFSTYDEARQYLNEKVKPVFPDAFIIKVQGGKKIK
ncbi:MAG: hypothetical protein N2Z72_08885 [Bacteroidales bacterium]|nr:hypothetical protein [Bacteroidales bacterium]